MIKTLFTSLTKSSSANASKKLQKNIEKAREIINQS